MAYEVVLAQVVGLLALLALAGYVESKAAMRGSHRKPLPDWVERGIRLLFLLTLLGPTMYSLDKLLPIPVPIFSLLLLAYIPSYIDLSEKRGGRKPIARTWRLWGLGIRRFNIKLVSTQDLPAGQAYIFGVHPHGVLPIGGMVGISSAMSEYPQCGLANIFPHIDFRTLAATFCFYVPIYRDILLYGGVVDAARYVARKVLDDGHSLALVPGGATEALYGRADKDIVYLRKRRGFVKLALETGASLVPIFSFNENNTYDLIGLDWPWLDKIKHKFQAVTGISLPVLANIIPKKTDITVVVGGPIKVPKVETPSDELVAEHLQKYMDALQKLYDDNREKYNDPPTKPPLSII